MSTNTVTGQSDSGLSDSGTSTVKARDSNGSGLVVGINNHYRVGHPTAINLDQSQVTAKDLTSIQLQTLDGDGVRVRYSPFANDKTQPQTQLASNAGTSQTLLELGYVVPGSEAAPIAIYKSTEDASENGEQLVAAERFPVAGSPRDGPSMIPSAMPWVVSIGDPLGVENIGASNVLLDKAARIAVTKIPSADRLPRRAVGYSGVDLVMIGGTGLDVLKQMSPDQTSALSGWLGQGGRLFVTMGDSASQLADAAPWLMKLLPIEKPELLRYDPAAMETFTSSQNPLASFSGIRLPRREGRVLLAGRTMRRLSAVLAAEYAVGFGSVIVVAADLESASFSAWPERIKLVSQLVGELFAEPDATLATTERGTSFTDLAGQMRGVLDQFSIKPRFGFSVIALIVMALIAAVGPLDYLLINRVFGKPLLGWLTFPLLAVALSVFLVAQAAPRREGASSDESSADAIVSDQDLVRANQFQIVDLDFVDGVGRGFGWAYLYSHHPAQLDLSVGASPTLRRILQQAKESSTAQPMGWPHSVMAMPMGYPGKIFGGIQLADENSTLPPYAIQPFVASDASSPASTDQQASTLKQLTIPPRSSKSVATRLSFAVAPQSDQTMVRRPGSQQLRGKFTNPLSVDVLDGILVYQNLVYRLPTRLPAGGSIASVNELRQGNFRWRLSRRQALEKSATENVPWDPVDFSDMSRVAEMLMFHEAAGGRLYTGLDHLELKDLDLSKVLLDDRCVLVGRTEEHLLDLNVVDRSQTLAGEAISMIRVVMPVRSTRLTP